MRKTIGSPVVLVILAISIFLAAGLSTYSVAVFGSGQCKNGPDYTVTLSPTSASVQRGASASFQATLQSICKFGGQGHFSRTLTPNVTNGPQLPPPSCYNNQCNVAAIGFCSASTNPCTSTIGTAIGTSSATPAGTYTFTLTVTLTDCQLTPCLTLAHSATASLTVT